MRILYVSLEYPPVTGGGSTYVHSLVKSMLSLNQGNEIAVMTGGDYDEDLSTSKVIVFRRRSCSSALHTTALSSRLLDDISKVIISFKPDVIHGHHTIPILALQTLSMINPIRCVYTQHRTPELPGSLIKSDGKGMIAELAYSLARNELWIAPSKFFKQRLIRSGIPSSSIKVIWPSIDYRVYKQNSSAKAKTELCKKLGITNKSLIITIPVVDRPRKDVEFCFKAIEKACIDCTIIVTGINRDSTNYIGCRKKFPNLNILAHDKFDSKELPGIMGGSDAVILSSTHEGFGLAAIEALSVGTRVYLRRSPGLNEIIENQPMAVPFTTIENLADQLKQSLCEPRTINEATSQSKSVSSIFSTELRAKEHLMVYKEISDSVFSAGGICLLKNKDKWYARLIVNKLDNYQIPKGRVRDGETWEKTAIREIREETGINVCANANYFDEIRYIAHLENSKNVRKRVMFFYFIQDTDSSEELELEVNEPIKYAMWVELTRNNLQKMEYQNEKCIINGIKDLLNEHI